MTGSLFSWVNAADGASIVSVTSQSSIASAVSALNRSITEPWRIVQYVGVGSLEGAQVVVDFGQTKPVYVIGLFGLSFTGGFIQFRLGAGLGSPGGIYPGIALPNKSVTGYGTHIEVLGSTLSGGRYLTIDITRGSDASFPPPPIDVGRIWAGDAWLPSIDPDHGWGDGWNDLSKVVRTRAGTIMNSTAPRFRSLSVGYSQLSLDDRIQALEMERVVGNGKQIMYVPNIEGDLGRLPILGRIAASSPLIQPDDRSPSTFARSYRIEQDL
jgi:hypothetical protein